MIRQVDVAARGEPGPRWFTFGGWLRGGPSARAAQILLLSYAVGFTLSMVDAVVVLVAHVGGGSASTQRQPAASALAGYLFLLALALIAATLGMTWFADYRPAGIEGLVIKSAAGRYLSGRGDWVKVKNRQIREVVVGAVTGSIDRPTAVIGECCVTARLPSSAELQRSPRPRRRSSPRY